MVCLNTPHTEPQLWKGHVMAHKYSQEKDRFEQTLTPFLKLYKQGLCLEGFWSHRLYHRLPTINHADLYELHLKMERSRLQGAKPYEFVYPGYYERVKNATFSRRVTATYDFISYYLAYYSWLGSVNSDDSLFYRNMCESTFSRLELSALKPPSKEALQFAKELPRVLQRVRMTLLRFFMLKVNPFEIKNASSDEDLLLFENTTLYSNEANVLCWQAYALKAQPSISIRQLPSLKHRPTQRVWKRYILKLEHRPTQRAWKRYVLKLEPAVATVLLKGHLLVCNRQLSILESLLATADTIRDFVPAYRHSTAAAEVASDNAHSRKRFLIAHLDLCQSLLSV